MASNLKVDIIKPTATNGSLSLKGDSGGSATSNGISVDSSGDTSITGTTTIATADINGGNIDGTTIGGTTPAAGTFTSVDATSASLDGAVTINESGADVDFRVEASGQANALFVEGSSGNVGVGTSSPTQELEIKATSIPTLKFNQAGTYGAEITLRGNDLDIAGSANDIVFYTGVTNDVSSTERMRIDSSGNVGIGTSSPSSDGGTTLEIYNVTTPTLKLNDGGDYKALFQLRGNDLEIRGSSANIKFYTGNADGASSTEAMSIDSSGNLKFDSGYGSVATAYGCRAWVNFNGTGTVAIRESGNVSSITDNGTGYYTVNFANEMPDANYSVCSAYDPDSAFSGNSSPRLLFIETVATSSFNVETGYQASPSGRLDFPQLHLSVFR